jgi:hypothetical protein
MSLIQIGDGAQARNVFMKLRVLYQVFVAVDSRLGGGAGFTN